MCNTYEDWYEKEFNKHESLLDEEIVLKNHKLVDENGIDVSKKKSSEKTVEERIKTSRSLKIKYNKWNQVDFTEDNYQQDKMTKTIPDKECHPSTMWSLNRSSMR